MYSQPIISRQITTCIIKNRKIILKVTKKRNIKGWRSQRGLTIGVWAGGAGRAAAPPNFGQLSFFGQQEKFGKKVFKKFPFFSRDKFIDIFYYQ